LNSEALRGKVHNSVCVLGLTYTAKTSTLRRSPGLWLIESLLKRGFDVSGFDPRVLRIPTFFNLITDMKNLKMYHFDCFILVSPWDSMKDELSDFVKDEYFIDIEGYLLKNGLILPEKYQHIF
jgi:UDP-N-acetyl-D-mannosaminuronate dehydrogenase